MHGGPGSGAAASWRRFFDPARYRVVLFDQRGCGRSALGLGYAQRHPDRFTEIVLFSVVTSTPAEHRWLTHDLGRIFPERWERSRDAVPAAERDGNLPAAYARLLADPDPAVRDRAARLVRLGGRAGLQRARQQT